MKALTPFSLAGNEYHADLSQPFVVAGIETLMVFYPQTFYQGIHSPLYPNITWGDSSKGKPVIYLGKVQGISAWCGTNDGDCRTCQMLGRSIVKRSGGENPWGIGWLPSHLLRSSAITFWAPGIWLTSISIPVAPDNRHSFSKKTHKG